MKIVVFSDIHGNGYALNLFFKQLKKIKYDKIVFCGDVFGYYYQQKYIVNKLKKIPELVWLKGNHDKYFCDIFERNLKRESYIEKYGHCYAMVDESYKELYEILKKKQAYQEFIWNEQKIGIFHGTPEDALEGRLYPDNEIVSPELYQRYDIVILGHTHCRMCRKIGDTLVMNSGSLGQPRDGNEFGFALLNTENLDIQFIDVPLDTKLLYCDIDVNDSELKKLKEILERRKKNEKNIGYCN